MAAVNINCLDDVDPREIAKLAYHYDGELYQNCSDLGRPDTGRPRDGAGH